MCNMTPLQLSTKDYLLGVYACLFGEWSGFDSMNSLVLEPENVGGVASDASDFGGDLDDNQDFPDNFGEEPLLTDGEARFASENAR